MARRNPLAMLLGVAAVAAELARVVREARPQSRPEPLTLRRALTDQEVLDLRLGRRRAERLVAAEWCLTPEDAARVAMAWPALTPLVSLRLQ